MSCTAKLICLDVASEPLLMFLLDTHVISELRKARSGRADESVARWAESVAVSSLFVSAISVMEIEMGVLRMERQDPRQGLTLRSWLDDHVIPAFSGRVLGVDLAVARCCAQLHVPDPQSERDSMIAATALVHGMTLVTRNEADFESTGVAVLNPWLSRTDGLS